MHKHRPSERRTVPFSGALQTRSPQPRAHGNVTEIATCTCGATRRANRNQGWVEYGQWAEPTPARLIRYSDATVLRDATPAEREASAAQARRDGGAGVIDVGGVSCYVED